MRLSKSETIVPPRGPTRAEGRTRRQLAAGAVALVTLVATASTTAMASPAPASRTTATTQVKVQAVPDLGANVTIFTPDMTTSSIKAVFDRIHAQQVDNEMGSQRYGLYFMPGTYGTDLEPLQVKVGYYTEVAGLGASPSDVQINGTIEVRNRCFSEDPEFTGCFALNNFWRGLANLTINVNTRGKDGCDATANFWAVSQAVSLRRVDVKGGDLSLMDYCSNPAFASGGFIADSRASTINNGSQQQWYARNTSVNLWTNAVWNQVFSGMVFSDPATAPQNASYPDPPYTVIDKTPLSREKPYLYADASGKFLVRVPSTATNTTGLSWANSMTPGRSIPIGDFYVARPGDSGKTISKQLARGKHLILTPGVYDVSRSIEVKRANTIVLGMGLATLTAVKGATPLKVADKPGIVVAGVTVDAGTVKSPALLRVGKAKAGNSKQNKTMNPITLSDVYFRIGGPHIGRTDVALLVNSDNVLIDHTWVWRADHGIEGFDTSSGDYGDTERWKTNIGVNGVIVNGDHVTATGLFVEHFQQYNTIWNGEKGRVLLYQCELPYDPPTQADWKTPSGTLGWSGYKVGSRVKDHQLFGGGVYAFNRNNPSIVTENGYEVPDRPGVKLTHVMTKNLSGPGIIRHVVNGFGDTVDGTTPDGSDEPPSYVVQYVNGVATLPPASGPGRIGSLGRRLP